jgi:hypothetical protein
LHDTNDVTINKIKNGFFILKMLFNNRKNSDAKWFRILISLENQRSVKQQFYWE